MKDVYLTHPLDLDVASDELDLFAEEVPDAQRHDLPPNSFSTLGCECDISTFFCYGCGLVREAAEAVIPAESPDDFDTALKWAREKMAASPEDDMAAEVIQSVFRSVRRRAE